MKSAKLLILWIAIVFVSGCILTIGDGTDRKSSTYYSDGMTETTTNVIVITNDTPSVITNLSQITNTVIVTNTDIITDLVYISNNTCYSNDYYFTNEIYSTNYQTNTQYITNVLIYNLTVDLTEPTAGEIVDNSISVAGNVPNAEGLSGTILYVESTNGAIISANYGAITGNQFGANITVSQQGCYYIWATAWDSIGTMGISEKVTVIADWSPPSISISTPSEEDVTLYTTSESDTADFIIGGHLSDDYSGGKSVYIQVDCCTCIYIDTTDEFERIITLSNGTHTVSVVARDNAGLTSLPELYTITVQPE